MNTDDGQPDKKSEPVPEPEKPPVTAPLSEPEKPATILVTDKTDLLAETVAQDLTSGVIPPMSEPPGQAQPLPPKPADLSQSEPQTPEPGEVKSQWTCPRCPDKSYDYRSHLARHINRVHVEDAVAMIAALPLSKIPMGRPKGSINAPKADFSDLTQKIADTSPVDYQFMSEMMFNMTTGTLAGMFGPEWLPREDAPGSNSSKEKDNVVACIKVYLQKKEVKDIPPGIMLTIVAVAYAGPRLKAPATATKIKLGFAWLKSKFQRKGKLRVI